MKQFFRIRQEPKNSFIDYYMNEKPAKPIASIPLTGSAIRDVPSCESMTRFKRKHVLEIQEPSRKWRLDFGDSYSDKVAWLECLNNCAFVFPGKVITVDCTLARNSPKDGVFNNVFDAVIQSSKGDTIQIRKGEYFEELPIVKSLKFVGEEGVVIYPPKLKRVLTDSQVTLFSEDSSLPASSVWFENLCFDLKKEQKLILVHSYSGSAKFVNCTFTGGDITIKVSGESSVYLEKCIVTNAKRYGLLAKDSAFLSLKDCDIRRNGYDGIYTEGQSKLLCCNNVIEENTYNGLALSSQYLSVLVDNTISKNKWDGVSIGSAQSLIVLEKNQFSDNFGMGIYFSKGKGNSVHFTFDGKEDLDCLQGTKTSLDKLTECNTFANNKNGSFK